MKHWLFICLGLVAMFMGCGDSSVTTPPSAESDSASGTDEAESAPAGASESGGSESGGAESGGAESGDDEAESAPATDESAGNPIELTPSNTSIQFTGNHTGDDPKPRLGSFQKFTGTAVVDGTLRAVTVDIETASLKTEIDKLTNHLKNADFFDVNQFPTAKFKSTEIKDNGDGTVEITGDLTLLDKTGSVTFPAKVGTDGGLKLTAEFEIDRTQWGMTYGPDQIEKQVPMKITIGG